MRTIIQSDKDVPQFEAVALIYEERCPEPNRLREEAENTGDDKSFPLEEARRLAQAILRLDGLTAPRSRLRSAYFQSIAPTFGGCERLREITRC
jgi:hypothetical protein